MPTRDELLADHFMKAAGIAAVYVDAGGAIGAADTAGMSCPAGRIMLCCARGNHAKVAGLAVARMRANAGQAAALAAVREAAAEMGIGLTPHDTVIRRAFAAVETVNLRIAELQATGGMREMNTEFKAARKAGTEVRYQDFLRTKKIIMLEAIAGRL
jgi:hypothetical protein